MIEVPEKPRHRIRMPFTDITISGYKAITGIQSSGRQFTFVLTQVEDETGAVATGDASHLITTGRAAPGNGFSFTVRNLTAGKTYYFKITESMTGNGTGGWTYDPHELIVEVVVTDNGNGTASAVSRIITNAGSDTFINIYTPPPPPDDDPDPDDPDDPEDPRVRRRIYDEDTDSWIPVDPDHTIIRENGGYTVYDGRGRMIGRWVYDPETMQWIFEQNNTPGGGSGGSKLPQTGLLQWPIPVLAILGLGMILLGRFLIRRRRWYDA